MAQLTKQQLQAENQANFPNNTSNYITPTKLRNFNSDSIDSTVNQLDYNSTSASFDSRINQISGSGIQGSQGTTGAQGIGGNTGPQGIQGYLGPIGPDGPVGLQGPQGIYGTQGATGIGVQGATGAQGHNGIEGTQGAQGISGQFAGQGAQGTQGAQGAGTQGAQGAFGLQGYAGAQGPAGNNGAQGAVGSQGANGANGTQGSQGTTGAGTQGSTGVQGAIGSQGTQGTIGAGTQGATGTQGVQGIAGSGGVGFATTGSNTFQGQQTIQSNNLTFGTTGSVSTNGISFPNSAIWQNNFLNFQAKGNIGVDFSTDGTATNNGVNINFRNNNNNGDVQFSTVNGNINLTAISGTVALSGSNATRIQGVNFITFSSSLDSRINAITGSGGSSFPYTGSANISGSLNLIGPLSVAGTDGSSSIINFPFTYGGSTQAPSQIYQDSNGDIVLQPNAGLVISGSNGNGAATFVGNSPSLNFSGDLNGAGAQYPQITLNTDAIAYVADGVYAAYQIGDAEVNGGYLWFGMAANSYTAEYGPETVSWIGGGVNNSNGSNTAIIMRTGSVEMEFFKPVVFNYPTVAQQGFAQEQLITDQSISAGSDTVVTFNHSDFDPSGWYNGEFFYFQPTIAGTYQVSYGVNFESVALGTGQINTQIRLNGTSVNINQSNLNVGYNQTLNGTYLVQMNGTTDTLDLSAYSSAATTILASNGTFFNIKLL